MSISKFIVSTIFRAGDQVSPAYNRMGKRADRFGSKSYRAFRKASAEASKFKSITGGILAAGAISRATSIGAMAVRGLADEFISFDQAIISTAAKMDGVEQGTESFLKLQKTARQAGATTEFTATEAAKAMNSMAMSSFNLDQTMAALPGVIDLATISEKDLEFATQAATDTLNSFNMMETDNIKLAKNMARVNDVLAKTFTSSTANIEDLAETMKHSGAAIHAAGGELEDFAFLAGAVAKAGVRGSLAGTTLKNMFLRLVNPVGKAKEMLKKLRVEIVDKMTGKMRTPLDIFAQFTKRTEKMGEAARLAALNTIFGQRAIVGVSKVMSIGSEELEKYRKKIKESTGSSVEMAAKIRQSLQNRLATLKSSLIDLGFQFIFAFSKAFPRGIDTAIAAVRNFDITSVIETTKKFIVVVGELYTVTKNVVLAVSDTISMYTSHNPMIQRAAIAIGVLMVAMKIVTVAQWVWNTALSANPIGLIIIGIAAWISAIYDVYNEWTFLKVTVLEIIDDIDTSLMELLDNPFFTAAAVVIAPWLTIPALIKKHWTPLMIFFELLIDKLQSAVDFVLKKGQTVADFFGIETDLPSYEREREAEESANRKAIRDSIKAEGSARYEGRLLVEAPPGSKLEGQTKTTGGFSDPFEIELLGANP